MGCLGFPGQPDSELRERVETGGAIRSVRVSDEILVLHRRAILRQIDELATLSRVLLGEGFDREAAVAVARPGSRNPRAGRAAELRFASRPRPWAAQRARKP